MSFWTCKICGKEMPVTPVGIAGVIVKNRCDCGQIRSKARREGCPKCGRTADHAHPDIQIRLKRYFLLWKRYEAYCVCGHTWRVKR